MKSAIFKIAFIFIAAISAISCNASNNDNNMISKTHTNYQNTATATFGAGCFWCVEAIFEELNGVVHVESGYSGGHVANPTYEEVCTGTTGHAEVIQITFNPEIISYIELLEVFWKTHDPTTLNRQGPDVGPQYRSVIFYHNDEQHMLSLEMKEKLDRAGIWENPIVTEIVPYEVFYKAEDYHQDYYSQNMSQPYCTFVITPKIRKFHQLFEDKLKENQ